MFDRFVLILPVLYYTGSHASAIDSQRRWRYAELKSLGGSDNIDNLALACRRCNERRYNFVAGVDPETQEIVPIFNPRRQKWEENDSIRATRRLWIKTGLHPPSGDPCSF